MRDIISLSVFIMYFFFIHKISNYLLNKFKMTVFKVKTVIFPLEMIILFFIIFLSPLSFQEAGFVAGNIDYGIKFIVYLGIPLIVISSSSAIFLKKEDFYHIRYFNFEDKWMFIYLFFIVGIIEETIFRGFLQSYISLYIKGNFFILEYSTILASFIFMFFHLFNVFFKQESIKAFLSMMPSRLIASLILGYGFQISESILYTIIVHNLIDGINIMAVYLKKKKLFK
ncbi:CPBP family intramembrane metalloprotease [Oceanotoga sp. DSM 15011]|uniref:CPBP family intramembrane glutamic endopeptidase n=1 Tax=Oceanotoga sp. DSM 15011 TaxID=2984951 RepID=UPI0021F4A0E8|nr:CPBP family intramembrane glutamic endopeptidase [Oceanotoga sp. DSM 15011]UYO99747.1 CPBP family intramembrane metalloprotease [Oceanotoga sp. DSM 15011]